MDIPTFRRQLKLLLGQWAPLVFVLFLSIINIDQVFASSDTHEVVGWVATDSYRVLNFIVLATCIFFVLRKPIVSSLNNRVKEIKTDLEELETQREVAQSELVKYDDKLAKLDKEAEQILAEYVEQGKNTKKKILSETEIIASKIKEQAKGNIRYEFEQARIKLKREVVDKAIIKAELIIKKEISEDDQAKLMYEYLEKVVA